MNRTDLELEKLLLGELPEPIASALREELRFDPTLAARYQLLSVSNAKTLAEFPPGAVAHEVERRRRSQLSERAPGWRLVVPVMAAAALAVAVGVQLMTPAPDETRIKGLLPTLYIYRDLNGKIEQLQPDAVARQGDRVQLRYAAAGAPWGVLLSIDGRGGVTMHHPLEAAAEPRLESGPTTLPRALELDDAPLFERFIFVTCQSRPDVARVVAAAQVLAHQPSARVAALPLEPECSHQLSFVLSKELR